MDIGTHPALRTFHILQELSPERGNKTYLARQRSGNLVAIKVLASREISEEESSLLSKEASLGARLGHDAILQSRALIVEKDFAAVVTEFVPGVSLQRLLRFAASRGVRLPDVCASSRGSRRRTRPRVGPCFIAASRPRASSWAGTGR
jgi:hypothetical protein